MIVEKHSNDEAKPGVRWYQKWLCHQAALFSSKLGLVISNLWLLLLSQNTRLLPERIKLHT